MKKREKQESEERMKLPRTKASTFWVNKRQQPHTGTKLWVGGMSSKQPPLKAMDANPHGKALFLVRVAVGCSFSLGRVASSVRETFQWHLWVKKNERCETGIADQAPTVKTALTAYGASTMGIATPVTKSR